MQMLDIATTWISDNAASLALALPALVVFLIMALILWSNNKKNKALRAQLESLHKLQKEDELQQQRQALQEEFENKKQQSKNIMRSTLRGQIGEELCPFNSDFQYNAADCHFSGEPIDFLVYHHLNRYRDEDSANPEDIEIVFLEVKTGYSQLSREQKAIRHAINQGRVRFETYYADNPLRNQKAAMPYPPSSSEDRETLEYSFGQSRQSHASLEAFIKQVEQKRLESPRAHIRWEEPEKQWLRQLAEQGLPTHIIAETMERPQRAIESRLKQEQRQA